MDVPLVVIKAGATPTTLITRDNVTTVDVKPVEGILDTTGAGDAFAAGFLVAHLGHASHRDCLVAGHQLAARVLQSPGATMGAR